jgi:hypothetical protein
MKNTILALGLGCLLAVASACTPFATYPQGDGPAPPNAAVNAPLPDLMAVSVIWANSHYGTTDDPAFNLPAYSTPELYQRIIRRMRTGHPVTDPAEPAFYVMQVRARGAKGEVDMFLPKVDGTYAFATVKFRLDAFKGYVHESTRWWETGEVPPPPNYGTPAPQKPAAGQPVLAHE